MSRQEVPLMIESDAFVFGAIVDSMPRPVRRVIAPIFDAASSSYPKGTTQLLALRLAQRRSQFHTLVGTFERPLAPRFEQEQRALWELRFQTRQHLVVERPLFPDLPDVRPDLRYIPLGRRLVALVSPHLSRGIPEALPRPDLRPEITPGQRVSSPPVGYDFETLESIFPKTREERQDLQNLLYQEADNLAKENIPPLHKDPSRNKKILDRLRFLGLAQEDETDEENERIFIETLENTLIERMRAKGVDTGDLSQFMEFAKATDWVRAKFNEDRGRRKTGESYYCHYLSSAWILWTMIERDFPNLEQLERMKPGEADLAKQELTEAEEDVKSMFIHDLPEDLFEFYRFERDYKRDCYRLYIDCEGLDAKEGGQNFPSDILNQGVTLSYDQRLILQVVTKDKQHDDGAHWLEKIRGIRTEWDVPLAQRKRLLRRAARCKAADRFSNLLTMTAAGGECYDVIRKLNETIDAGGQLLWISEFEDFPPMKALEKLRKFGQEDGLEFFLGAIPLMAEAEKVRLLIHHGQEYYQRLTESKHPLVQELIANIGKHVLAFDSDLYQALIARSKSRKAPWMKEPWVDYMITEMKKIIRGGGGQFPPHLKRLCHLSACCRPKEGELRNVIPADDFSRLIGLPQYMLRAKFDNLRNANGERRPIEFGDFEDYIRVLSRLLGSYDACYGILPGGIDDFYVPLSKELEADRVLLDLLAHLSSETNL